jgi:membrane protease YdiL (CAAX protease family)
MYSLTRLLHRSLVEQTPRDHRQSPGDFRRRQLVSVFVLAVGAGVLAFSLRIPPGSAWFYPATLLLALVWALGALASGPLHLGRLGSGRLGSGQDRTPPRPVWAGILIGGLLSGVFVVGALVVRELPALADQVRSVLAHGQHGSGFLVLLVTVVNGIAEEMFFRGAAYAAIPRHQVVVTAIAYAFATAATGNVMLAFAALVLGVVVGLVRRATGGVLAPVLTHLTWSVAMLYALPAIFGLG